MNLLMIRHGEIPSNVNKVYAGRSAECLTEKGVQQAMQVSEKLKDLKIYALYSSPIQRAIQTAQIVGGNIGIDPVVKDAFRELEMGPWEGMSEVDIAREYPEEWDMWNSYPAHLRLKGRETLDVLLERVLEGVRNIYKDHPADNIIVVTHVAIIRVLLLWHAKKSLNLYKTIHVPNAEILQMRIDACTFL